MPHRIVVDIATGDVTEVDQTAYRNDKGEVVILDAIEKAPRGYSEMTSAELQAYYKGEDSE